MTFFSSIVSFLHLNHDHDRYYYYNNNNYYYYYYYYYYYLAV